MAEREIHNQQKAEGLVSPAEYASERLAGLIGKSGSYDGRLFVSDSKVTYTYVCDDEVITLHFDRNKRALFYKGHHVVSAAEAKKYKKHFEKMQDAMLKNDSMPRTMLDAFQEICERDFGF